MGGDETERVVARGRDAVLIDLGNDRLLKRFRSPRSVEAEAAAMAFVRAAGYPAPRVFETRPPDEIVIERIAGPTMLEDLGDHPWRFERHARVLADLHRRLHDIQAPPDLPALYGEPDGEPAVVLHQDLHPGNVLLPPDGPVVIDWTTASRGPAGADIADAWLVLAAGKPEGGIVMQAVARLRGIFVGRFLHHAGRAAAVPWLAQAAARRSGDPNMSAREKAAMARLAERY